LIFWIDRIAGLLLELLFMPRRILSAFLTGVRGHNLNGWRQDEIIEGDVDEEHRYVAG